jgi:hypothetical protein
MEIKGRKQMLNDLVLKYECRFDIIVSQEKYTRQEPARLT